MDKCSFCGMSHGMSQVSAVRTPLCYEAELTALRSLVRETVSALIFATYGSPSGINKRAEEILNRTEVKKIMEKVESG